MSAPTFDLTTATPSEVDTALAEIHARAYRAMEVANHRWSDVEHHAAEFLGRRGWREPKYSMAEVRDAIDTVCHEDYVAPEEGMTKYHARDLLKAVAEHSVAQQAAAAVWREAEPFNAEFERRGGWTRAFLVVTSGVGHVHSSMACSTCNKMGKSTQFNWLPEVSGRDEDEIVRLAGERACTVCYPSAPVEVLASATHLFTPDEQAKAKAREEREAKRAEREAAKVVVDGMMGWTNDRGDRHVYPTVRGATNAIAGWLGSLCWYGESHPSSAEWLNNVEKVRAALEAKGVDYDYCKALAAARKKAVRDGGEAKF